MGFVYTLNQVPTVAGFYRLTFKLPVPVAKETAMRAFSDNGGGLSKKIADFLSTKDFMLGMLYETSIDPVTGAVVVPSPDNEKIIFGRDLENKFLQNPNAGGWFNFGSAAYYIPHNDPGRVHAIGFIVIAKEVVTDYAGPVTFDERGIISGAARPIDLDRDIQVGGGFNPGTIISVPEASGQGIIAGGGFSPGTITLDGCYYALGSMGAGGMASMVQDALRDPLGLVRGTLTDPNNQAYVIAAYVGITVFAAAMSAIFGWILVALAIAYLLVGPAKVALEASSDLTAAWNRMSVQVSKWYGTAKQGVENAIVETKKQYDNLKKTGGKLAKLGSDWGTGIGVVVGVVAVGVLGFWLWLRWKDASPSASSKKVIKR